MQHDRMTGWACVNAILAYLKEPETLYGEFCDAADGQPLIDPVSIVHRVRRWRQNT